MKLLIATCYNSIVTYMYYLEKPYRNATFIKLTKDNGSGVAIQLIQDIDHVSLEVARSQFNQY